jgi:hypothetical protein
LPPVHPPRPSSYPTPSGHRQTSLSCGRGHRAVDHRRPSSGEPQSSVTDASAVPARTEPTAWTPRFSLVASDCCRRPSVVAAGLLEKTGSGMGAGAAAVRTTDSSARHAGRGRHHPATLGAGRADDSLCTSPVRELRSSTTTSHAWSVRTAETLEATFATLNGDWAAPPAVVANSPHRRRVTEAQDRCGNRSHRLAVAR